MTYHARTFDEMMAIPNPRIWDVCIVADEARSYIYNGAEWTLPEDPPEPPEDPDGLDESEVEK